MNPNMQVFIADIDGQEAILRADESFHCTRVLRKKIGDSIVVINGKGLMSGATLIQVHDKKCLAELTQPIASVKPPDYYLHLAIAPTKNLDRMEWMLEKVVELGIGEVTFFTSGNSERTHIKIERMVKIVESATKQCLRATIPTVNALSDFETLMALEGYDQKYIAHCYEGEKQNLYQVKFLSHRTLVIIGPEGDFTPNEVQLAQASGFKGLSLGASRLRTETAGLFVGAAAALSV